MAVLLRNAIRSPSFVFMKNVCVGANSCNKRFIMTSRVRLDKVLEGLQKNPYFDKYADKIAKFQQTSPEEFMQRVDSREKKFREKKDAVHLTRFSHIQSLWTFPSLITKTQLSWTHLQRNYFSDNVSKNIYITTPIYYVNAGPHIGHLYTTLLADTLARYNSMLGHSVFLCTGTDEHGSKVAKAAESTNLSIETYCNMLSKQFQQMCDVFHINYAQFIRTTENRHQEAVHHFWDCLEKRGHIYKGKYCGWYCTSDEAFISDAEVTKTEIKDGDVITVCTETGNPVAWTEEESYKFRLSSFEDDLKHWLKDENVVQPAVYHKILTTFLDKGLEDLSISRPTTRVPWAIPTPSDNSHTIYVWLDALVNYLTAVGYPDSSFRKFWPPTVQVVGKDILKFHGIYWPAFLMAAGLEPPRKLICHGHWTVDDLKMSKSKGNVVSPFEAMTELPQESLRYFLLRHAVLHSDANYNVKKMHELLNAELANTLGNLINRCFGKSLNPRRRIPDPVVCVDMLNSDKAKANIKALEELNVEAKKFYEECNLHSVADASMHVLRLANQMFDEHQPWRLPEREEGKLVTERDAVISLALESARVVALVLHPLIPLFTSNILDLLEVSEKNRTWEDTIPLHLSKSIRGERCVASEDTVIFKRI